jgi:selenocysteine lyase/cysteine desulfurase
VAALAAQFEAEPGYLAAATCGIAPRPAVAALRADLDRWSTGLVDAAGYDAVVARTRADYARLVGVTASQVAIGSVTSALVAQVAAGLPEGAEVLLAEGDFTSLLYPFLAGRFRVRTAPVDGLAAAVTDATALVAFSLVQSATGEVADGVEVARAAAAHGALTLVDLTQAAGVLPVDAGLFDATVCHTYKWLCAPRGVAFLTLSPALVTGLEPLAPGWYAGADPWRSVYGTSPVLAADARRFDVSPAWQAFVGASASISLFADADLPALWEHAAGLGDALCDGLGLPARHQAIVTWPDPDGRGLARLTAAGLRVSGRAGRVRAAFHVWNTADDVAWALDALSGA